MSLKRIVALTKKELLDTGRNPSVAVMYVMPILLTFIWGNLIQDMPKSAVAIMGILFAVVMIGIYPPAMMVAEEKEKKTLRVLMLSPAKPTEILLAKGIFTLFSVLIVILVVLLISQAAVGNQPVLWTVVVFATFFSILLGFVIGLLSPNQMATGYIGFPAYLILLMVPVFSQASNSLKRIAKFIPTEHLGNGLNAAIKGQGFGDVTLELAVLVGTSIVMLGVFLYAYRRREFSA